VNVAVTVVLEDILTTQVPVPEHPPPDQPVKLELVLAEAVKVTLPLKEALQVAPQFMPAGLDVTVPEPVPDLLTVRVYEGEETTTSVQAPQLLLSSDSQMIPPPDELVLSAQTRMEEVPEVEKVIEGEVAVLEAPAPRVLMVEEGVWSVTVPPPFAPVAFWKKYGKETPVETEP
jgi:hypothetical protein